MHALAWRGPLVGREDEDFLSPGPRGQHHALADAEAHFSRGEIGEQITSLPSKSSGL